LIIPEKNKDKYNNNAGKDAKSLYLVNISLKRGKPLVKKKQLTLYYIAGNQ
jgi:hypothetical protein